MDWMNSVGDAISAGFDTASGYATDAFSWLGDNPEAANLLGGIAAGAAQGYMQNQELEARREENRQQRAFERDMYEKRRQDRMAKPGEVNGYDSHLNSMTTGLISNGMIAGGR